MTPNFNDALGKVPLSVGDDLYFKWSNKLGTYDTSSFDQFRTQGRLSGDELEELKRKVKGAEIWYFNSHCQKVAQFICCFFLGIPVLVSIILATLGRIEAVLILSWMCICVFCWALTSSFMDGFAYLFIKCRAKRVKRVFEEEWWTGDRIKRVKVETGELAEYLKISLMPLSKIDPQDLLKPAVSKKNATDALGRQLDGGDTHRLNTVSPVAIIIKEDFDESQLDWVPQSENYGQP